TLIHGNSRLSLVPDAAVDSDGGVALGHDRSRPCRTIPGREDAGGAESSNVNSAAATNRDDPIAGAPDATGARVAGPSEQASDTVTPAPHARDIPGKVDDGVAVPAVYRLDAGRLLPAVDCYGAAGKGYTRYRTGAQRIGSLDDIPYPFVVGIAGHINCAGRCNGSAAGSLYLKPGLVATGIACIGDGYIISRQSGGGARILPRACLFVFGPAP